MLKTFSHALALHTVGVYIVYFYYILPICAIPEVIEAMEKPGKLLLVQIDDCRPNEDTNSMIKLRLQDTITTISHLESLLMQEMLLNNEEYSFSMELYDRSISTFIPLIEDSKIAEITRKEGVDRIIVKIKSINSVSSDSTLLRLKGRSYDTSNGFTINGNTIQITSPGQAHLGTGLTIWDGSYVLAKHLEHDSDLVAGKRVLEVGAGTGIAGIAAALLHARTVYITDLLYALDNLRSNVEMNIVPLAESVVTVQELDWSDDATYPHSSSFEEWDIILGADVVWLEHLVPSLVKCLSAITGRKTKVIIAHQSRSRYTDELFFQSMEKMFSVEQVLYE